ncbi:hypothetical protein C8R42DRAFT_650735 [Lentinula raphanica]|nr:hypothetical protein C8R42DRAFT_650735 [Lentinula raphanica]
MFSRNSENFVQSKHASWFTMNVTWSVGTILSQCGLAVSSNSANSTKKRILISSSALGLGTEYITCSMVSVVTSVGPCEFSIENPRNTL